MMGEAVSPKKDVRTLIYSPIIYQVCYDESVNGSPVDASDEILYISPETHTLRRTRVIVNDGIS